ARLMVAVVADPIRAFLAMMPLLFVMNASAAFYCCRRLRCPVAPSVLGATIFGASHYFLDRVNPHFFLALLIAIPLSTLLVCHVLRVISLTRWEILGSIVFVSLSPFYYAVFGVLALCLAGSVVALVPTLRGRTVTAALLVAAIAVLLVMRYAPISLG